MHRLQVESRTLTLESDVQHAHLKWTLGRMVFQVLGDCLGERYIVCHWKEHLCGRQDRTSTWTQAEKECALAAKQRSILRAVKEESQISRWKRETTADVRLSSPLVSRQQMSDSYEKVRCRRV